MEEALNYTKRELYEHFKDVKDKINEQNVILKDLANKVGTQNGRVGKLETKIEGWIIAVGCITFLFSIITGLIVYSFQLSQENLKHTILLEITEMK